MREFFIVTDGAGNELRRGSMPESASELQPLADGETLRIVTREEWRVPAPKPPRPGT